MPKIVDLVRSNLRYHSIRENCRKLAFYFRRQDLYWQIASLTSGNGSGPLGMYPLDLSVQLACGHYSQLDDQGVPVRWSRDGRSLVHNYTRICGYALAHWNLYVQSGEARHLSPVLAAADYICRTAKRAGDAAFFRAERTGRGHIGELSSMSQGQGMSVLCRAWQVTQRSEYFDTALASLRPFRIDADSGGVLDYIAATGTPWFEEYPGKPAHHVLNGMIFATWGLHDLALATSSSEAKELWQMGIDSIASTLPLFDSGYWSWYSITDSQRSYIASMMYHNLHVAALTAMFQQTQRSEFLRWSETFRSYAGQRRCRLRAAAAMLQSKFSAT